MHDVRNTYTNGLITEVIVYH